MQGSIVLALTVVPAGPGGKGLRDIMLWRSRLMICVHRIIAG
jgi:hypothetical protein